LPQNYSKNALAFNFNHQQRIPFVASQSYRIIILQLSFASATNVSPHITLSSSVKVKFILVHSFQS